MSDKKYVVKEEKKRNIGELLKFKHEIGKNYIRMERGKYVRVALPYEYPKNVFYGFLKDFVSSKFSTDIGVYLEKMDDDYALHLIQRELTSVLTELHTTDPTSYKYSKLMLEKDSAEQLRDLISARLSHLYRSTLVVTARGDTYSDAEELHERVMSRFRALNFQVIQGIYRVWEIFKQTAPIIDVKIPYHRGRVIHTDVATALFPFVSATFSVMGNNAILLGLNAVNDTPVFIDRFVLSSYNMLVFGKTGSGKSYFEKLTMVRSKMNDPDILIYAIDPLGENGSLFEAMGGKSIRLWNPTGEGHILNPLDPRLGNSIHERVDGFIASLSTLFDMTDEESSLMDVVLTKLFTERDEEFIMSDVIAEMENYEGLKRLRNSMRIFEKGSLSFLNRKSNINIGEEKYVNFDLKGTPDRFLPFFMFMISSFVYSQIRSEKNRELKKLFYIDEVHHIWKFPKCAELLEWMARHTRHYKAGMTLLTQSANDGFVNEHTRAIMENAKIHLLLYHDNLSDETRKFYKLLPKEEDFIYSAHSGKGYGFSTGLLRVDTVKIPLKIYASGEEDKYLQT